MPLLRDSRPSTSSDGGHSIISSSSTKRRFPLLGRRKTKNSELSRSSTNLLPTSSKKGFRVHVQVKFEKPLDNSDHTRDYDGSPKFVASDRVCQALLSRLQHCSAELITRHDCNALDPLQKPHRDVKPLRYRITYRVERDGLCLVEKSLRSFQEYELTSDDAREVVAATDRIVGHFMLRHDPGFRWAEVSEPEAFNVESETARPCTGRPQSTCCIPRSRFVNTTQKFELIPGYSIELFLRSRCVTRYPENRNAAIKIDSLQPTPLTLLTGEELTTRVCNLIDDPVCSWKRKFDKRHKTCDGLEGSGGCQHVEDGAVDLMIKVRNNLGPDYNYFSHRIQTSKALFSDPQGRDFDEFANTLKAKMEKARDMTDHTLRSMDDFTLKIRELRGKDWEVHEPLTIRLDPSVTYCRQTIEAIIERLQSGISNVLEGHEDALATMTAHKRGHLIYDGFLDGAGADDDAPREKFQSSELEKKALVTRLRDRIKSDITMLCKDTCALDCSDTLSNLKVKGDTSKAPPMPIMARPASEISVTASTTSERSDHTLSKKQAKPNLRAVSQASLVGVDLQRVPSGVEAAKRHGYMPDYNDDDNLSEPPSTPSLIDTDSISPRDSAVVTPQSSRNLPVDQSNQGLRIIDDGHRIIYQERSDEEEIARGGTEIHHFEEEEEEAPIRKGQPIEMPLDKPSRRSFDTRMPDLSGKAELKPETPVVEPVVTPQQEESAPAEKPVEAPVTTTAETSVEVPVVEAPVAIVPAVEAPPTETPAEVSVEPPVVEAPAVETPAPVVETPAPEVPLEAPVEVKETPVEDSVTAPIEAPREAPVEAPVETPVVASTPIEPPTEAIVTSLPQEKVPEPTVTIPSEDLPHEGILEYVCQPASPVPSEGAPVVEPPQKSEDVAAPIPESATETKAETKAIDETPTEQVIAKEPITEDKKAPSIEEAPESSQDDSWEMVEVSQPDVLSEGSQQVEASTKSETSLESNSTEPETQILPHVTSPAVELNEDVETPKAEPIVENILTKASAEEPRVPSIEVKDETELLSKDSVASTDATEAAKEVAAPVVDGLDTKDIALDDFPKPPSVKSFIEETPVVETRELSKTASTESPVEVVEEPVSRKSEDSAIDLKEISTVPATTEEEVEKQEDKPAAPSSEDSGISIGEQAGSVVAAEVTELKPAVAPKDVPAAIEEIVEKEDEVENTKIEESSTSILDDVLDEYTKPVLPEVVETGPVLQNAPALSTEATQDRELKADEEPKVEQLVAPVELSEGKETHKEEEPKVEEPVAPINLAEEDEVKVGEVAKDKPAAFSSDDLAVPVGEAKPTVPEIVELPVQSEAAKDVDVAEEKSETVAAESAASVTANVPDVSVPEPAVATALEQEFTPTPIVEPISEEVPAVSDDVTSLPTIEEARRAPVHTVSDIDIPRVILRPRLNTLSERPKSMAFLDIDSDPFDGQDDIDGRPMSAVGSPRRYFQHNRQPSAGLLGFHEQRLMAIGLRNAMVPYRFRPLRRDSDSRPGTSYSEQ